MRTIQFSTFEDMEGDLLIIPTFEGETLSSFVERFDQQLQGP